MKLKVFFIFTVFSLGLILQIHAQSCRDLYREAKSLEKQGKLEKAKTKYQQVISCGDKLYYDDSKERVNWIDRILRKPNLVKPFAISENEVIIIGKLKSLVEKKNGVPSKKGKEKSIF